MRLPASAHTSRPWRIHELAPDLRLEDVWALPTPGGPGDFPRLVELMEGFDPAGSSSAVVRALFAIRWKLGDLLRVDGPRSDGPPFTELYRTDDEWALEIVNKTVHGVLHLGWVEDGAGGYRGQLAVLVKPNGRLGELYMKAITPFRHLIVYPTMLRDIGRTWSDPDGRVRQIEVPDAVRSLSTLSHIDYEDAFLVETDAVEERTAEEWARAVLEEAPLKVRAKLLSGWSALGLKLDCARSGPSVLGWPIRESNPDFVLLGADSLVGMPGQLLFKRQDDSLLFATFVQQDNRVARTLWARTEPAHVPIVRQILEHASRRSLSRGAAIDSWQPLR
jgi:hypothetical protein